MQQVSISKPGHDLAQLTDGLFAAFPQWRRPSSLGLFPGAMETDVRVSADGDMVVLSIPEEDETAVREKVEAHVPQARQASSPTAADVIAALAAMTLENVTTVEDLKAAIQPIRETAVAVIGAEQAQGGERQ